jgi:hypothetical protein
VQCQLQQHGHNSSRTASCRRRVPRRGHPAACVSPATRSSIFGIRRAAQRRRLCAASISGSSGEPSNAATLIVWFRVASLSASPHPVLICTCDAGRIPWSRSDIHMQVAAQSFDARLALSEVVCWPSLVACFAGLPDVLGPGAELPRLRSARSSGCARCLFGVVLARTMLLTEPRQPPPGQKGLP